LLWKNVHVITAAVHLPVVLPLTAQLVAVAPSAQAHPVKSLKAVKSLIHAGFEHLRKNEINLVFALEFLNLISQKMSLEKS
jgi:hypothetical protein